MSKNNKEKPSKKAVLAKKEKIVEDATFGLKNKNKSKKVQQFITRVEKSVKNSDVQANKAREAKKEAKLAKQLQDEELRVMLNEGVSNQFGKKKSATAAAAAALGVSEANKDVQEFYENLSTDSEESSDEDDAMHRRKRKGPIFIDDSGNELVATEVFREKTIEDIIEEQRLQLAKDGKKGTPVTAETFADWQARKMMRRKREAEERVKAEQAKKKGGKGLSVLSGKELFSYNASLFVDDDAALDESDEQKLQSQTQSEAAAEEQRLKEENERIQAEQQRLFEEQQLEFETRRQLAEEKRRIAMLPNHPTFVLAGVKINQVVFDVEEEEDLEPFPKENFVVIEHEGMKSNAAAGNEEEGGDEEKEVAATAEVGGDDDDDDVPSAEAMEVER